MKLTKIINLLIIIPASFLPISCNGQGKASEEVSSIKIETEDIVKSENVSVIVMNKDMFKQLVWDYEASPQEWVYNGKTPCIVDFYADWCGPCRKIAPIMAELAKDYAGKITIYKVNVDKETELASVFGVQSLPSILFCPMSGKPAMQPGALSKDQYKQAIDEFLLK